MRVKWMLQNENVEMNRMTRRNAIRNSTEVACSAIGFSPCGSIIYIGPMKNPQIKKNSMRNTYGYRITAPVENAYPAITVGKMNAIMSVKATIPNAPASPFSL